MRPQPGQNPLTPGGGAHSVPGTFKPLWPGPPVNLKTLSQILGLSQTTVSRALNGYPEVSEATRQRVLEAAVRHNYLPNARARSLAMGRAMAIGHVIPVSDRHEMVNPVFSDFIAGAGETYTQANYEMILSIVPDAEQAQAYRAMRARGSVDGVIVHGPRMDDARIALLREIGLPFVVHGRASALEDGYDWLDVDNTRAFARATDFLLDLGHRQIGLINGLEEMDFAHRRRAGYLSALEGRGLSPAAGLMHQGEMTEVFGYRCARAMLEGETPPTAILLSSMICAIGARRAIEETGRVLGRDVSVITFDDDLSYLKNGEDVPIFTAARSSVREAGRQAAQLLLDRIARPEAPPRHVLLEAELIVGRSTGPAPG